ncbi:unnamed protein product, partial [Sphacelaria rigidula]
APKHKKVVVRRLPHDMKEDQFLEAVTPAAAEAGMGERGGSWDLVHFAPGKMSKKRGRVTSTAYIRIDRGRGGVAADLSLMKLRAAITASSAFSTGKPEKPTEKKGPPGPTVEPAPFQKLFKQKPKRDARVGTIDKDPDYKAFCAALEKPTTMLPSADIQADIKESEGKEEPKPTNALLDFLKERGAKRMRDSQRAAAVGSNNSGGTSRRSGSSSSTRSGAGGEGGTSSSRSPSVGSRSGNSSSVAKASTNSPKASGSAASSRAPPETNPSRSKAGARATESRGAAGKGRSRSKTPPPPPPSTQTASKPPPAISGHSSTAGQASAGRSTASSGRASSSSSGPIAGVAKPSTVLLKARGLAASVDSTDSPRSSAGSAGGGGSRRSKGRGGGGKGRSKGKVGGGGDSKGSSGGGGS